MALLHALRVYVIRIWSRKWAIGSFQILFLKIDFSSQNFFQEFLNRNSSFFLFQAILNKQP